MPRCDSTSQLPSTGLFDVRLLPLPNLVVFPEAVQLLHVFEPRYRRLVQDSLHDDRLLATAFLEPGWERDYDDCPSLAPTVCVAEVISDVKLSDGRYNILIRGMRRAQIRHEPATDQSYRSAEVELVDDQLPVENAHQRPHLRRTLMNHFRSLLPVASAVREQFELLLSSQMPLGTLIDIVAFTLQMSAAAKQELLEQLNVDRRASLLMTQLGCLSDGMLPLFTLRPSGN